jgi:site-specific DNA-methyltransferase (adenine-specific)/site-specific DNA-methyltransferase (cytosine-N4-specific)
MNVSQIGHPQHHAPDGCQVCVPAQHEAFSPEVLRLGDAKATLYYGIDIMDGLRLLPDDSIHCVATSPPFWLLRDFGGKGQLGREPTLDQFLANLVRVSQEIRRVLRPDGIYWMELGDGFVGQFKDGDDKQDRRQCGLQEGNLIGVPWRVALALQADGWWLRSDVIWHKTTAKPEGNRSHRPVRAHDYIFILAKSQKAFWDAYAIRERCADGQTEKFPRSVWAIAALRQPKGIRHPAPYPFELARRMVVAGSSGGGCCPKCGGPYRRTPGSPDEWEPSCACKAGDPVPCTVLDPFSGSATTGSAALANGRNYVGIDLNADYLPMARKRIRMGA